MTDARPSDAPVLPTPDEEDRLWSLVEQAWARQGPEPAALHRLLLDRDPAERFGAWPETRSGLSRESFSNGAGWQDA